MNTSFMLLAQYDGRSIIPLDLVCRDYFTHLTPQKLAGKIDRGEVKFHLSASKPARRRSAASTWAIWRHGSMRGVRRLRENLPR